MPTSSTDPARTTANPETPLEPDGFEADGSVSGPLHLMNWAAAHHADFQPPVGNKYLYSGRDFFTISRAYSD